MPVKRIRVKGYTRPDGKRVKPHWRKAPSATKRKKKKRLEKTEIRSIEIAMFRKKGDKTFFGANSRIALDNALEEVARVTGGTIEHRDSVWRDAVVMPRGTQVADLIRTLPNVEDVDLLIGRIHFGVVMPHEGRKVYVPISKAYSSLAEVGVFSAAKILDFITKYLPNAATVSSDDAEEESEARVIDADPMETFTRRSVAARKGWQTRRRNARKGKR